MSTELTFLNLDNLTNLGNIEHLNSQSKDIDVIINELSKKDVEELMNIAFDGDENVRVRSRALQELYLKNKESANDAVNRVTSMYSFSPTFILKEFLFSIVQETSLPATIKNDCAMTLYDSEKKLAYKALNIICKDFGDYPVPLKVELFKVLFETEEYVDDTKEEFCKLILDKSVECEYRYKILLSIPKMEKPFKILYLNYAYYRMAKCDDVYTRYRILCSQYILQNKEYSKKEKKEIEKICIGFANDTELDYNLRADAADLLFSLGSENARDVGRDIIQLLGEQFSAGRKVTTIYENRQNVHSKEITQSVDKYLKMLSQLPLKTRKGKFLEFSNVQTDVEKIAKKLNNSEDEVKKVKSSLLRISLDQFLYNGSQSLQSIFVKIWQYICDHEHKNELKKRMVEELIDMSNSCMSGHLNRLINVLSGFEIDGKIVQLNVGWEDQIKSNLVGRLNKMIQDIKDEELQSKILDEMGSHGDMIDKPDFMNFFRINVPKIRDELYKEFVSDGHVTEEMFEIYIRNSISFFEEGK